jgi:CubicO group peptidase (beta-lactamase class C family)
MDWRVDRLLVPAGCCLFLIQATAGHAAALSPRHVEEISRVAVETLEQRGLPALSLAVAKNGEVWTAAFGKADIEQDVAATPRSMFRTGSIAKWFTAAAALILSEHGELDLDAPIQRYCPQYPPKPWPVTSRQLLMHMSGVRHNHGANGEKADTEAERQALDALVQRELAMQYLRYTDVFAPLETFKNDPLLFEPGTRVHYSSLGYRLLGCVLEVAGNKAYRQLMRELVFEPAGMVSIVEDDVLAVVPHRVAGYGRDAEGRLVRATFRDVSENLPAGGYLSTAEDLVRFAVAFNTGLLVEPTTRERMIDRPKLADGTPAPNPMSTPSYHYGMGVMVDPSSEQPAQFHTGGQSGATALLFYFPDDDVTVALMTNIGGGAIREALARRIAEIAARK